VTRREAIHLQLAQFKNVSLYSSLRRVQGNITPLSASVNNPGNMPNRKNCRTPKANTVCPQCKPKQMDIDYASTSQN